MESFRYHRYRFAERLHRIVNMLTCTGATSLAIGFEDDKSGFNGNDIPQSWKDELLKDCVLSLCWEPSKTMVMTVKREYPLL